MRSDNHGTANRILGAQVHTVVQSGVIRGNVTIHQSGQDVPVPRQLPRTAARFVSRPAEEAGLDAIFTAARDGGGPALALIAGPGGVGKTALAVAWGSRWAADFPDGQLYVDMRGFSPEGALRAEQAIEGFLRAFGIPSERVPVDLAEQAALFRSVTADRKVLVVVDNALSAAQVRPLCPASAGSMVIVTSRLRLSGLRGAGGVLVELNPLSTEQAVDLLSELAGNGRARAEPAAVRELAGLCGRLPIALQVVGTRLMARPRHRVARVVGELADERLRLARLSGDDELSVHAVFDLSYEALSDEVADVYRAVSAHPGADFSSSVAAAAAQIDLEEAEARVLALVDASLVEEVDDDRYRFHDLVRLHALGRSGPESAVAARRVAEWHLREVTRANLVVIPMRWRVSPAADGLVGAEPAFPSGREALDWLDGQLPNVLAVLDDTAARGWNELAWQLCEALWELFLHRKHYRQWLASHRVGVAAAARGGDGVAESRLRCQLARAYLELGDLDEAERECLAALELARRWHNRPNESVALDQLGMVAQRRGDVDRALLWFGESLAVERELGIARGVAQRHRRIGDTLLDAGRAAEAEEHLACAHRMMAELGDTKDMAKIELSLAVISARSGRVSAAREALTRASATLRESGSAAYQADALIAWAEVCQNDGDTAAARAHLANAVALTSEIGGAQLDRARKRMADLDSVESSIDEPARPGKAE